MKQLLILSVALISMLAFMLVMDHLVESQHIKNKENEKETTKLMIDYRLQSGRYKYHLRMLQSDITDNDVLNEQKILQECEKFDEDNKTIYQEVIENKKQCLEIIEKIWGKGSKEFKYINKSTIMSPPRNAADVKNRIEIYKRKKAENEEKINMIEVQQTLLSEAILYLQEHDKKLTVDFEVKNAIETANDLAFDLAVEETQRTNKWHSFAGDDNCENCKGWDGVSHRCDCGNRRVSWTRDGSNFKNLVIYPEAH